MLIDRRKILREPVKKVGLTVTPGPYLTVIHGIVNQKKILAFRKDFIEAFALAVDIVKAGEIEKAGMIN